MQIKSKIILRWVKQPDYEVKQKGGISTKCLFNHLTTSFSYKAKNNSANLYFIWSTYYLVCHFKAATSSSTPSRC